MFYLEDYTNMMYKITSEISLEVTEEIDKFIFKTIQDWIYREQTILIPKQLIITALQTFKAEHPEQYKLLLDLKEN